MAVSWTAAVPWTAVFWLGFVILLAIHARMLFGADRMHALLGLTGAIFMFVGSKLGREFLGIA